MEGLKNNKSIKNAVVGKLAFAVKQTIKRIVDGEQVTEETVEKLIDMKKLAYKSKRSIEYHQWALQENNALAITCA